MRESTIEKAVTRFAQERGWQARKQQGQGHRGKLDHYYFKAPGQIIFIEYKAPGKCPTKLQQREITLLRTAGFKVYVIDSIENGKRIFAQ